MPLAPVSITGFVCALVLLSTPKEGEKEQSQVCDVFRAHRETTQRAERVTEILVISKISEITSNIFSFNSI